MEKMKKKTKKIKRNQRNGNEDDLKKKEQLRICGDTSTISLDSERKMYIFSDSSIYYIRTYICIHMYRNKDLKKNFHTRKSVSPYVHIIISYLSEDKVYLCLYAYALFTQRPIFLRICVHTYISMCIYLQRCVVRLKHNKIRKEQVVIASL